MAHRLHRYLLIALVVLVPHDFAIASSTSDVQTLIEGRDPRALAAALSLTKSDPKNADAWVLLTRAQLTGGKLPAAIDSAKRAVDLDPNNSRAHFWLGNAYGSNALASGMLTQMRMATKARDAFEKAVALDPNNLEARQSLVEFYTRAPRVIGGGIDKARAQATEIAKRDAYAGHLARGTVAAAEEKVDESVKEYQAAIRLKPDSIDARLAIGLVYQQAKRWDDAFAHFTTWTREAPTVSRAWYQLGRTSALSNSRHEQGVAAMKRYLEVPRGPGDPEPQHAYYRMGQIYAHAGQVVEARAAFEAALKLDPKMKGAREELQKLQ